MSDAPAWPAAQQATPDALDEARRLWREDRAAHATLVRQMAEKELRADPTRFEPLDLESEVLVFQGEANLARRLLEEYVRYYPDRADASARLAWVLWQEEQQEEAIAEARAALAREPANLAARRWLLEWQLEKENWAEAAEVAQRGLEFWPEEGSLWLSAARARAHERQEKQARRAFERALELGEGEAAARAYAEFLLDLNHTGEAARLLEPWIGRAGTTPQTCLRAADALFRSNQPAEAIRLLRALAKEVQGDSEDQQAAARDLLNLLYREAGIHATDEFTTELMDKHEAPDGLVVEILEAYGARNNRSALTRVFNLISQRPQQYPRALARFLSTFYEAPVVPGSISRWVLRNGAAIDENTILWGGVGAWLVQTNQHQRAVEHLGRYVGRPGLKPWMLLLLARALESLGDVPASNTVLREALQFPPDHSEPAIRSRLALRMALDGLAPSGHLIAMDCTPRGREYATVEDLARLAVVESLHAMERAEDLEERRSIYSQTLDHLKDFARRDPQAAIKPILADYRRRVQALL